MQTGKNEHELELELKETLRYLMLPIDTSKEQNCLELVKAFGLSISLDLESLITFIKLKYEGWRTDGMLDEDLSKIIRQVLKEGNTEYSNEISENYFDVHLLLQTHPFISFEVSTIVLSYLRLMLLLSSKERMSAAKIARVLTRVDTRLDALSWKEVSLILKKCGALIEISQDDATKIYSIDEELEIIYFADATIHEASSIVGEVAKKLRFPNDIELLLRKLSEHGENHIPYLQILHYQCLISESYNHILSVPYEFSPRGNTANWLFAKWDNLVPTGNPILNNAKAVDVLDYNWARSRKKNEFELAFALVDILQGFDEMSFTASQELASWIRRWLIRYIKLNTLTLVPLPDLENSRKLSILSYISNAPTNTYGILEQRFLDVLASTLHPFSEDWKSKGIGDAVNANNTSRKKLGDCDFQNTYKGRLIAYEIHGGTLNNLYLEGHLRTFKNSFQTRKTELEGISGIEKWTYELIFVAYKFEQNLPSSFSIDKVNISLKFLTLKELLDKCTADLNILGAAFDQYFTQPINNRRTPSSVREKIRSLVT